MKRSAVHHMIVFFSGLSSLLPPPITRTNRGSSEAVVLMYFYWSESLIDGSIQTRLTKELLVSVHLREVCGFMDFLVEQHVFYKA